MTAQVDPGLIEAIQTAVQEALNNGPEQLLRLPAVREECGLSTAEIYRQMNKGQFPRPYKITPKSVAWKRSEIGAWINSRVKAA